MTDWPIPNEHGVFSEDEPTCIRYELKGDYRCEASICVLQVGENDWLSSHHYSVPGAGYGGPLTHYHNVFSSEEEAFSQSYSHLKRQLEYDISEEYSDARVNAAKKILTWLESLVQAKLQPKLF